MAIMVTLTTDAQKILDGAIPSLKGEGKINLKIDFSETKIDNKSIADWLEYRQATQPKYDAQKELEEELKPVVQEKILKILNNKLSKKGAFVTINTNAKYTLSVKPISVSKKGDSVSANYILTVLRNWAMEGIKTEEEADWGLSSAECKSSAGTQKQTAAGKWYTAAEQPSVWQ